MSKSKIDKDLITEKVFVAAIKNKMKALTNGHFCKARVNQKTHQRNQYSEMSSAERKAARRAKAQMIRNEIHLHLCYFGLSPHYHDPKIPKATTEESAAIRIDFNYDLHRPQQQKLSFTYQEAKQSWLNHFARSYTPPTFPFKQQDYDLNNSPVWQKLQKLSAFRQAQPKIIYQLRQNGIPPQAVSKLNFYDFTDVMVDYSISKRSRLFIPSREKNIKMFAECYKDEFTRVMKRLDYPPENIKQMLKLMRQGQSPNFLDFHHHTYVCNFKELKKPETINDFSNMLLTFAYPQHKFLHFNKGYDIDRNIVFFGGFDPSLQIKRNLKEEQKYLLKISQPHKKHHHAKSR